MFNAILVKNQLIEWIKSYFKDLPNLKAVIGISGGKDSTVAAALCVEALGANRVLGVLMPCGIQADIEFSHAVTKHLKIENIMVDIAEPVHSLYRQIEKTGQKIGEIARINTPARIRMATLYAVCANVGGRVVNTCNLSEDYVGYSTKFGDSAGDFSPLSMLTATEVIAIGHALNLPKNLVEKTPLDGLSGATDEENLGFSYAVLDKYIRENICESQQIKEKIDRLHAANLHKISPMPAFILLDT